MVDLTSMKEGESGVVVSIQSGQELQKRLDAIGIRVGVGIVKVSSQFMHGPVTLKINNTCMAIGFGMAKKIMVEVKKNRMAEDIKKECK